MSRVLAWLRGLLKPTAFRLGLLAGLVAWAAAWAVITAAIAHPQARYNVEVVSNGADVSRLGGRRILVDNEQGVLLTDVCNEGCDDLWYRTRNTGENSYGVQVLDAAGQNLLGREFKPYVDSDTSIVMRWTLAGKDALAPDAEMLVVQKDGSLAPSKAPAETGRAPAPAIAKP